MDFCKCYIKTNIKCAKCDKPYKIPTSQEEQIEALKKKIQSNKIDNICYKLEIQDLENEIQDLENETKEINKIDICDEHTLIEHCSNNSDDEYTTKSVDFSSTDSE